MIHATYRCIKWFSAFVILYQSLVTFYIQESVYYRNMWSRIFNEIMSVSQKMKLFCITVIFSPNMSVPPEVLNRKSLLKYYHIYNHCWVIEYYIIIVESSFKNKSPSHFLEEIFRPEDSKRLRLRSAAFEIQLSHSVWVHQSNALLLSPPKQFLVCSEEGQKRSFTSRRTFSKRGKR